MPSDKARGNGHKLKHRKFNLKIRKIFFYCKSGQTLGQVAQRSCGISRLRSNQNLSGYGPGQPAVVDPTLSRTVRLEGLQEFLPAPTTL